MTLENPATSPPAIWSEALDKMYLEQVVHKVRDHARTDLDNNIQLGYKFKMNRDTVIAKGLANFVEGYESLSAEEKVLLYCFINMKGCFFSTCETFRLHKCKLQRLFDENARTVMFDVGCGPGTSMLALNELFPKRSLAYKGIDVAPAMREKAKEMWFAGVARGLISRSSTIDFRQSWTNADLPKDEQACCVLLNFSYFFDSHSLNESDIATLVKFVQHLVSLPRVKRLTISFTNSPMDNSNKKYRDFKTRLGVKEKGTKAMVNTVTFQRSRDNQNVITQKFIGEVIEVKL